MDRIDASSGRSRDGTLQAHRRRFYAFAAVFVVVQAMIMLLCWAAFESVDVARAYVAGEAVYSKAQKSAVVSLTKFAATGDAAHYRKFEKFIAVNVGDRLAREALERSEPDFNAATRGFKQGQIPQGDIFAMNLAFVALKDWGPFALAVADWRAIDTLCSELIRIGAEIRTRGLAGTKRTELSALMARVDELDDRLTTHETAFSAHMRDATYQVRGFAFSLMLLSSALLVVAGLATTWRISRQGAEAEQRFKGYTGVASDWFCELDEELRIVYLSDRFQEVTGLPVASLIGRLWPDATSTPWLHVDTPSHQADLKALRPFRGHVMSQLASDGTKKSWSLSATPILDASGSFAGYRATGTDISELVLMNEALRIAKDAAQASSRSKSAFLANMSHELRTPLNAIIGFSEVMARELFGPLGSDRYGEYVEDIHKSGRHLLSLINDVLDLSRIEAGKLELHEERIYLSEIVDSATTLCRDRAVQAGLRLLVDLPSPSPSVEADPLRLKQVLINLVSNAVKFTPSGGQIEIGARMMAGGALSVHVSDSGIGMTATGIAVALKVFGQVDQDLNRKYEGTGLGLPLAKTLVELHGGSLTIESTLGKGTKVTFTLPAARVRLHSPVVETGERATA